MRSYLLVALVACGAPATPAVAPPARPPAPAPLASVATPSARPISLDDLREHQITHGWEPVAVYTDDAGRRVGARLVHTATKFTFDYLRIESAPQAFIWVNSFPTSDKGEPHTQEHLLLGKGERGRQLGSFESMALAESSAFTEQWRTSYHFHTIAGHDAFWPELDNQLGALLYPNYTDEEIRREVRNFGVDQDPATGARKLEEKGTVYNEMVRTYEDPEANLWRSANQMLYGEHHPLSYDSGGLPAALRELTPHDIRVFHDSAYRLSNMGMVGAFPSTMALADVLDHTAAVLADEAAHAPKDLPPLAAITSEQQLPKPAPAAAGEVRVVDYPYSDTTSPGPMMFAWPASRELSPVEHELCELFIAQIAGDETTPLYKKLIDSKSRAVDLGASALSSNVSWDQGQPITIELSGVKADKLDQATLSSVRDLVHGELARIAALPDGDPELAALAKAMRGRIVDARRKLIVRLDTPPGFGFRGIDSTWMMALHHLERTPGFEKSLTLHDTLARADAVLAGGGNPWRTRLAAWGLLDAPYAIAAKPSTELRARIDRERGERDRAELARLQAQLKTADAASTLAAYAKAYDARSAEIERAAASTPLPPLVAHPPMTLDDDLQYTTAPIASLPALRATFATMTSAQVTLAFRLDAVAEGDLMYLALLPDLLSSVGMLDGDRAIAADEVRERQRAEISALDIGYRGDVRTGNVELVVDGSGIDARETTAALAWMKLAMLAPDWRVANVARLRDVVDHALTNTRARMLGAEESWVTNPRDAWSLQASPLWLHTRSFLTRAHDLHRLRWMLEDPGDAKVKAEAAAAIEQLAAANTLTREQLIQLSAALAGGGARDAKLARFLPKALSARANAIMIDAGKELAALVPELPASSLAADWRYLTREMAHDLRAGAPAALAGLARARAAVIASANARVVEVGAPAHLDAVAQPLAQLIGALPATAVTRQTYSGTRAIAHRLHEHDASAPFAGPEPVYVGLVDPATSSGVFVNTAPLPGYLSTREADAIDYLAAATYSGHGAHSMFMKTWAAGLAYSNGLHPEPMEDRLEYYAERCPLLPQTLRFVISQLRAATPDANIARYAIAKSFTSRVAEPFEARAGEQAEDLADGLTPDAVRAFRTKIVALASRADLAQVLFARMPAVYGQVLPGFGPPSATATYFVIGPETQLSAYQDYLHASVSKTTTLHRLYPRDYWVPAAL